MHVPTSIHEQVSKYYLGHQSVLLSPLALRHRALSFPLDHHHHQHQQHHPHQRYHHHHHHHHNTRAICLTAITTLCHGRPSDPGESGGPATEYDTHKRDHRQPRSSTGPRAQSAPQSARSRPRQRTRKAVRRPRRMEWPVTWRASTPSRAFRASSAQHGAIASTQDTSSAL